MTTPTPQPTLTPQFCFSTTTLQDFLRLSRSALDDSITANLNALLTPSRTPFDPRSTATRNPGAASARSLNTIPAPVCASFTSEVLFPSWKARTAVLTYCASVAATSEPGEDAGNESVAVSVDTRTDPYAARPKLREGRRDRLADLCRLETGVEDIVRSRTWEVLKSRCGNGPETWQDALAGWERGAA